MRHCLETLQWLPIPRNDVFEFFADAGNLEAITPPWLKFRIVTPTPITMRVGAEIRHALRVRGLPLRWVTEITAWEPPFRFVDEQKSGPYRRWVHEHRFEEERGGTKIIDQVEYELPGGPLEPWLHRFFVRHDLERIFRHRQEAVVEHFAAYQSPLGAP